ncbi:MAG: N-acetyltransferase [Actinomycetota bacterium]
MIVRLEEPTDRPHAIEVERRAFDSDEEPAIVEAVRDEPGAFAFVAEEDGRVVGHVQMSPGTVGNSEVLALGPIGVLPERQRRGIGSALICAALDEARARGWVAAIVIGDPRFYPRFGFEPGAAYGLRNSFAGVYPGGFEIKEEDFMLAPLVEGAREFRGPVRWHAAFGQGPDPGEVAVEGTTCGA